MSVKPNFSLSTRDGAWSALLGLAAFALYLRTLIPYPLPGDSGEFQVLVHQLGLAHTTGYSTYLLLGHAFEQMVPFGAVAWRVNLFSALMAALTVGGLFLASTVVTGNRLAAAVGAACLAVGYTFWSQAIIAEVYSTGAFFMVAALLCVLIWYRTGSRWAVMLAGLFGGAGLGAHGSLAPFGVAIAFFLLLNWTRWREWLAPGLIGALLGVAIYVGGALIVDANQAPANIFAAAYTPSRTKWNLSAASVETPAQRIWFLISAGQWRSALFGDPIANTQPGLLVYLDKLQREFSMMALLLVLPGVAALFRRDWRLAAFLSSALLIQVVFYVNYEVGDRYVFFIPSYLLLALFVSGGAALLLDLLANRLRAAHYVQIGAAVLLALLCVWPMVRPYWRAVRDGSPPFLDVRGYLVQRDTISFSRIAPLVTAELEPDAIVLTNWNWLYAYYYAAHIEQGKTGIQFIETYPRSDTPGLAPSLLEFIAANIAERPIYTTEQDIAFTRAGYRTQPVQVGPQIFYRLEPMP
jgi:hypothetical protein